MYSSESRVRYSEIDEDLHLTVPALINYLQDCSTFHSQAVGRGPAHAAASGHAWMLSAWEIVIDALPAFNQDIRVSTWPTCFKGLMAARNFTVCDAADPAGEHPLVRANSSWFLFAAAAGAPMRIPADESDPYLSDVAEPLDMPAMPRRIRTADAGEAAAPVIVTGAHIDTNHHVNNAQYVSLALGALPKDDMPNIHRLDVQYHTAAKLGDTIYPHIHHEGDAGTIITLDDAEAKPYAIVRVA